MDISNNKSLSINSILDLSWQSLGYGLGIFGRQIIIFLTLPIFTNNMPREEFGIVSFALAMIAFVNTLTNVGLPAATYRFYHGNTDPLIQRQIIGSSLVMFIFFATIPAIGFIFFSDLISQNFLGSVEYSLVIKIAAILLVMDTMVNYCYILLRVQTRPIATSLTNLIIVIFQMGSAVVLVYFYDLGYIGYFSGLLIGETIGLLILGLLVRKILTVSISMDSIKLLFSYGLPLLPVAISMWALKLADRALIGALMDIKHVAIYEIGCKIGSLVSLSIAPLRAAWPPFAFKIMYKPNAKIIYSNVLTYLATICVFFMLGVMAFKSQILNLLAPTTYVTALSIVGWIALSQVFDACYMVLSIGPKISKRTSHLAIIAILSAVVYLIMNMIMIPIYGIQGAAITAVVGYGILTIGSYIIGQYSYPFQLDLIRLLKVMISALCSYLLITLVDVSDHNIYIKIFEKIMAWFSFPFFTLLFGAIKLSQLREFYNQTIRTLVLRGYKS